MRFVVAALIALFVFVPAAQAQGTTGVPVIVSPAEGSTLAQTSLTITGTTVAATTVAVFDGTRPLGEAVVTDGTWSLDATGFTQGPHALHAIATDGAGIQSAPSEDRHITIDTEPPAAVAPVQTGSSEFTFAGEAGARYECRLAGAGSDTGFVPCSSPYGYQGLGPGDYTFSLQTIDAAGNRAAVVATRAFSIAAPPTARAEPTPSPAPAAAAELARTVVIRPLRGKVYVRRPGATKPTELSAPAAVAVGSEVDVRKGRVRLTAAATGGKAASRAEFFGGMFVVTQAADGVVDLALSERLGSCATKTGTRVRRLWGDGKGRFRTRGRNAVVTVRGTRWLVQDSCDGTLARVSQGVVSVRDTVKRKTFLVRAGRKYLAVTKRK